MKLLFMCVANSARSQVAEGLAKQIFPDAEIESAGSYPGKLSSYAVTVMKEIGIDISHQYSKSTDDLPSEFLNNLNYVITLCAEEVCPAVISKAIKLHWPMSDPFANSDHETLNRFREIRDSIQQKLLNFKKEIQ